MKNLISSLQANNIWRISFNIAVAVCLLAVMFGTPPLSNVSAASRTYIGDPNLEAYCQTYWGGKLVVLPPYDPWSLRCVQTSNTRNNKWQISVGFTGSTGTFGLASSGKSYTFNEYTINVDQACRDRYGYKYPGKYIYSKNLGPYWLWRCYY
jgi:hypothetical protein